MKLWEINRTGINSKEFTTGNIKSRSFENGRQRKSLESYEKGHHIHKAKIIQTTDFLSKNMEARRNWYKISSAERKKSLKSPINTGFYIQWSILQEYSDNEEVSK